MNKPLLPSPALSLPPRFARGLRDHGAAVALVTAAGAVSYADLADRAARFAARLGAGRKLVAIEAAGTVDFVAAYLGALGAGHAVAPVAAGEMARFRDRFAPDAIYAPAGPRWRLLLDGRGDGAALHPDLALLLSTSGSTGQGKAVRLSARAVEANAGAIAQFLGLTAAERAALVLPLHYSFGLSVLHSHLAVGASVWLAEGGIGAPGFLDQMRAMRATSLSTVPHGFDLLSRIGFDGADLPDLATLACAGGALPAPRLRALATRMEARGGRFFAMYGQTEATARIAFVPPERARDVAETGVIGQPIPGGRLWLREGELFYDGPGVMMGYAETRADLARGAEVAALATGDLAEQGADGLFRITGRKRRMSKIAGLRVGHDAVEAALAEAGIAAAVWGDDSRLHVAAEGGGDIAARVAALTGLTARHVALHRVERLPRLPNGKVDLARLQAGAEAPPMPEGVARAFAQVFHPRAVGPKDSFTSLGGDSLRHVELALVIEGRLGHLPARWEAMPVASLAALEAAPEPAPRGVDTALALRALAILAVVITHETLWPLYGGAAVMVVLIGLMLARFQRAAMARGDVAGLMRPLLRVLAPYYAILLGYALAWGQVPWGSALLISNFGIGTPATLDRLPFLYWFVEAFAQMFALLALAVLLPPVRRLVRDNPFRLGLYALGAALAFRFAFPLVWDIGGQRIFTLAWVLYLAALGWLVAVAESGRQKAVVLALSVPVMAAVAYWGGNWYGAWLKYGSVLGVLALLLYVPQLPLPRWIVRPLLAVAGASYLIYLTNRFVPNLLLHPFAADLPAWLFSTLSIAGGIGLGLGLYALQRKAAPLLARLPALLHLCPNTLGVRG